MKSTSLCARIFAILCGIALCSGSAWAQADKPVAFAFSSGGLPEGDLFQGDRMAEPRNGGITLFSKDALPHRELHSVSVEGGKKGLKFKIPPGDALYGEMSALTISLFVKFDEIPEGATFFHRLRGKRATKGLILFSGNRKGRLGDESVSLYPLFRVATDDSVSEAVNAAEQVLVEKGKWYQFAVVYNGSDIRFYVNGEMLGPEQPTFMKKIPAIEPERSDFSLLGISGAVGEFIIAPNQAFSAEQIKSLFENGLEGADGFSAAK